MKMDIWARKPYMMLQLKNLVIRYVDDLNRYHLAPENYQTPKKAVNKVIKGQVTKVIEIL